MLPFSFNPLWKLLIDKGMTREELRTTLGISPSTMAKMSKGEYIAMEILDRICTHFNCSLTDIVEYMLKEKEEQK